MLAKDTQCLDRGGAIQNVKLWDFVVPVEYSETIELRKCNHRVRQYFPTGPKEVHEVIEVVTELIPN
jgi:hypothetical protein